MAAAHGASRRPRRSRVGVSKSWSPTDSMMMSSPACLACPGGEMHLPAVLAGRHDAGDAGRGMGHVSFRIAASRSSATPSASHCRIPQRLVLLHDRREALAEDLDLDLGAGLRRDRRAACRARSICPHGGPSLLTVVSPTMLAVMPERRHVGRVAVAGIFDDQRDEALLHALLLLVQQRRLAPEVGLVPFDEALQPALQDRVVGRQVAASRRGSPFPAAANPARTCRTVSARASGRRPTPRRRSAAVSSTLVWSSQPSSPAKETRTSCSQRPAIWHD